MKPPVRPACAVRDSVAALVPRAEIQGEMGDSHMGLQARLMSQALRKITAFASKSNCTIIFINQLREKIGVTFGNPETTTGGRALKFYASVRIDIRRIDGIKANNELVGNRTRAKIVKNKVAPPFKSTEFDIMYGQGISKEGDTLDLAVEINIVNKSGAWYTYGETRIGQGRENAKAYLKEHPDVLAEIDKKVRDYYSISEEAIKEAVEEDKAAEKAKKAKKTRVVAEDDDDILIIPSDAYLSDEDDGPDTSIDDEMFDDDGFDE